jgi:hypothetical protein
MAYETLQYIIEYLHEHLSDNALVIKSKEQCKRVVPENNDLQDSQDKEEEHQEGEVHNELDTTNSIIVNDASLFSDDSCNAKTEYNLYAVALCLDTHEESITNDELEIEPCYESFDANMQEPISDAKEEYYELFSYNEGQGKALKFIHESQPHKKVCTPHLVHPHSLKSENLFIYKMSMHNKRVRLRMYSTMRCSKPHEGKLHNSS